MRLLDEHVAVRFRLSSSLLLLVLVPWQVCLTGCWSMFDTCCLRKLAGGFVGALDWDLGGMGCGLWVW